MGKKNGSKKRDKRNLLKRTDELATVFKRVEFNEDYRWYNEAEEDGEFVKVRINNKSNYQDYEVLFRTRPT